MDDTMNETKQARVDAQNEEYDFDADHSAEYDPMSIDMISYIRHELGLTQQDFAAKFKIPVSTLSQWEQHKRMPPLYVVDMICKLWKSEQEITKLKQQCCFNCTVSELLQQAYVEWCDNTSDTTADVEDPQTEIDVSINEDCVLPIRIDGVGIGFSNDERFKPYLNSMVKSYDVEHTVFGKIISITLTATPVAPKKIMDNGTLCEFISDIRECVDNTDGDVYYKGVCAALMALGYDSAWVNSIKTFIRGGWYD